ncbi:MAG: hypothetical protein M1834_008307 [Cirrosporium novae-zelandiae]|nr:MAG: hypothetical protein M1834_008307 [Cirrosporium novae-zelandiae]
MEDHPTNSELSPSPISQSFVNNPYTPIEDYGIIGNMRTCALINKRGSLDYMCWPNFDSPSVFCRLLDKNDGGHFSITPVKGTFSVAKQQYLMKTNILQTRWIHEDGVGTLTDFFARSEPTLIRRVKCIRGTVKIRVEFYPAFNYAKVKATRSTYTKVTGGQIVQFSSPDLALRLDAICDTDDPRHASLSFSARQSKASTHTPFIFEEEGHDDHIDGASNSPNGVVATFTLNEGEGYSFVLREVRVGYIAEALSIHKINLMEQETREFWRGWISSCKYKGRFQDMVERSLMILKLLTFEPTGAIVAAPTFSLPEDIGGKRNWDYRYSWVRDASFTVYVLLRVGFTTEAEAYIDFITNRLRFSRNKDGSLPIMFSIHGDTQLEEIELPHLEGYRGSRPVRIGNGASDHIQLDIYGELIDAIYLYNKYGKPVSYDQWVAVREITDYICTIWKNPDMSIWEVRGQKENFVYSKIMLWVAFDRALRLAFKRSFPCPGRYKWRSIRDEIYEDIMEKGFNKEMNCFVQSYESHEVLDSAVLIGPLVFFMAPNDPRFLGTLDAILKPPEKGGLTSTGLVYRYNHLKSQDGVGGREGSFTMCTLWLVEALTRAGRYDKKYLDLAVTMFEGLHSFGNHLGIFSEQIAASGEQLGNTPQAFSHIALISAAFNLDRTLSGKWDSV